ncbi:N-terminal Xaa-Pro-Lys N-methyltransferase 1 [Uranotaenia lowii]|uniref:N-terminal Xaa-Pro-Lys N-methyltransferase 1 n=1 Tax=Uranotaenia lowii TaxID=190385 RepID=UPI00247B04D5|nr:N-terminal Xaa-Pro-Lys N-methyltransferase 1 [Uranotaenia lowii]
MDQNGIEGSEPIVTADSEEPNEKPTTEQHHEAPSDNQQLSPRDEKYYQNAKEYWAKISPTVDGMLGGFGQISFTDVRGSDQFLKNLFKLKPAPGRTLALDCGAGIGRVSKNLLMPFFERVDLVEQDEHFCQTAERELRPSGRLGKVYNVGLQDFRSEEDGRYDVIWSQWVLGHLTDDDIVDFFFRCTKALKRNGMMIIKENFTNADKPELDRQDSSVTRPLALMKRLLTKGNLRLVKEQRQKDFPKGLYPVYMLALRPIIKS